MNDHNPNAFPRFTDQRGTIPMPSTKRGGPGGAENAPGPGQTLQGRADVNERSAPISGASPAVPDGLDLAAVVSQALGGHVAAEHQRLTPVPPGWVDVGHALREVLDDIATEGPAVAAERITDRLVALGAATNHDADLYEAAIAAAHSPRRRRGCPGVEGVWA
jgi:hypothetical protein